MLRNPWTICSGFCNPRAQRILEPNDRLLCFGKMELMRELIPLKTRRKRRLKVLDLPDLPLGEDILKEPEQNEEEE